VPQHGLLAMAIMHNKKSTMAKKYTSFAGLFDGHGNVPV
jgi:hypothetical protein